MKKGFFLSMAAATMVFLFLSSTAFAAGDTIKLGVFGPMSGPASYIGDIYFGAMKLNAKYWNEKEGGLFGKKIEVIAYDHQMKPDVAKRLAEQAILDDKVDVLVETVASHTAKVLMQVAQKHKKIMWNLGGTANELTGELCNAYAFRTCLSSDSYTHAAAAYFKGLPKVKKIGIVAMDYVAGHDFAESFKKAMKKMRPDAQIVTEVFTPVGTKDFAVYVTKIDESGAEWIFVHNFGNDLSLLVKQGKNLGLKTKIFATWIEDSFVLNDLQNDAVGIVGSYDASMFSNLPKQKEYNKYYFANLNAGIYPNFEKIKPIIEYHCQVSVNRTYPIRMLFEAAKRVGKWDTAAIIKKLEGLEYEGLNGKMIMRAEDHQVQMPMPVLEVVNDKAFSKGKFPGMKMIKLIPTTETSIPLSAAGCKRKAGEF